MPYNFTAIEKKWQQYWLENKTFRAIDPPEAGDMPKAYILDMFPYPSGAGLHVGHAEQQTATDILCRFLRMSGVNVLHPIGWDAFGLPAEQYAIRTNTHPRITTEQNIANFRRQIQSLGFGYDWDREVDTTDPKYYKWTQWIFLQLFNSYFDPIDNKARPISHLINELQNENLVVAPDGSVRLNPTQEGMEEIAGEVRVERLWRELTPEEQRDAIDGQRLAYMDEAPVNWCPQLGTVLANEEVIDGRSEVGQFPVERRPMRQWMLRITAYADQLLNDLEGLDWPDSLKKLQRNWIGKSVGAEVEFEIVAHEPVQPSAAGAKDKREDEAEGLGVTVFTTRPDTLFGATYLVLAPEHPLVDRVTPPSRRETVEAYRVQTAAKSDRDRTADMKEKTGVFTGAYAINPANDEKIPVWISDYVLMGYGTGAIMAVPAHDERDFEFAKKFDLPIRAVVMRPDEWLRDHKPVSISDQSIEAIRKSYQENPASWPQAFIGEGVAINSGSIDGLPTPEAKERIIALLDAEGVAYRSVNYKLRDWLFSRQRYWGEPFPILLDENGDATPLNENELPLALPDMDDFKPTGTPEPPLSKAKDWLRVSRDNKTYTRETNTMPQWAGSCWYYLRYIDPQNERWFVDPEKEKYWMPVDLYVGGAEHAVLHLLYARFWHKVLFDLGYVSTPEPFMRLVNQGTILGEAEYTLFETSGKQPVSAPDVEITGEGEGVILGRRKSTGEPVSGRQLDESEVELLKGRFVWKKDPSIAVDSRSFKMSKSRGNVVNPDEIVRDYGADTFRLYEMYMGPLEAQKPWNTRDIVGMSRFLNSVWRNLIGEEEENSRATRNSPSQGTEPSGSAAGSSGASAPTKRSNGKNRVIDGPIPEPIDRQMHRTIKKVGADIAGLRFNTAIAELIKLNNEMSKLPGVPRELAENFTLMLSPFAPHIAEEIWERLGHHKSLSRRPWPTADEAKLVEDSLELPVQVNGKLRGKVTVPADADDSAILSAARSAEHVKPWVEGKTVVKELYVPKKLVNFVVK